MRLTSRRVRLAAIVIVVPITIAVAISFISETQGIGFYDQKIRLKSSRPIKSVSYCFFNVNGEDRRLAEETADPKLFDWKETREPVGEWLTARMMVTTLSRRFFQTKVYHYRQLVMLAEFNDGTRVCRVVDLAEGLDKQPITINFD